MQSPREMGPSDLAFLDEAPDYLEADRIGQRRQDRDIVSRRRFHAPIVP
jgi:hypothetical protein